MSLQSLSWAEVDDLTGWLVKIKSRRGDSNINNLYTVVKHKFNDNVYDVYDFSQSEEGATDNSKINNSFEPQINLKFYNLFPIRKIF